MNKLNNYLILKNLYKKIFKEDLEKIHVNFSAIYYLYVNLELINLSSG